MILSYILHGNVPCYDLSSPHPDVLLDAKIRNLSNLLDLDVPSLTNHFGASRFPYSTQALPLNVLLDTLLRPSGETDESSTETCVFWRHVPSLAIPHLVLGGTRSTGGQWVENPVDPSGEIGTLSYANMLSLPGYSFAQHYWKVYGKPLPPYMRPPRKAVTAYFAAYPFQIGIQDSVFSNQTVSNITRCAEGGFVIRPQGVKCKHLVLATGIFSELVSPPPLLKPLLTLRESISTSKCCRQRRPILHAPLLVIGSGFSAADVILSQPPGQPILHIYKWFPSTSPSPLRACHAQAYPEYASIYRRMKLAAHVLECPAQHVNGTTRPARVRRALSRTIEAAALVANYEGMPNTVITSVSLHPSNSSATITLSCSHSGLHTTITREVAGLAYVAGRRGSLSYLSSSLRAEIARAANADPDSLTTISSLTLRDCVQEDIEIAPDVFVIGSLTGDSLIRFAYGSCVKAAGRIMGMAASDQQTSATTPKALNPAILEKTMGGLDGHNGY